MKTVLAADLGGTKCKFGLVAEDLTIVETKVVPTTMKREPFLATMNETLAGLREGAAEGPDAIGIGAAVMVPADRVELAGSPNLPLKGFALGEYLQSTHGLPVTVLNDGRASAWGEYLRGHAKGRDPLLVLFFGTGIGIGLIVDGQPYGGANNIAGEIGHTVYMPGGRECVCGNHGCYEAYCGGGPMTARAAEEIGAPPSGDRWSVSQLVEIANGEPVARAILQDAETAACAMVASLCTLLNPSAVVLGGGMLKAMPELPGRIERFSREWCTDATTRTLEFVPSLGGSDAILWGAAAAAGLV